VPERPFVNCVNKLRARSKPLVEWVAKAFATERECISSPEQRGATPPCFWALGGIVCLRFSSQPRARLRRRTAARKTNVDIQITSHYSFSSAFLCASALWAEKKSFFGSCSLCHDQQRSRVSKIFYYCILFYNNNTFHFVILF
jgi:hypothetical protein